MIKQKLHKTSKHAGRQTDRQLNAKYAVFVPGTRMLWVPVMGVILLWVSPPTCIARTVQQGHSKSDSNLAALREELDCPGRDSGQTQVIFRFRKNFKLAMERNG
jgi:hypothetical protein